ncbi:hypothetical protein LWI29_007639 [Acer saccharum]|uniref:Uncharacterized protein n=1 Tax=Acer saccharum TaxID=4024 RepID=A0AA39RBU7_ACESA|nr:hypothetical protein LWI29_007639 [Acer saccharum]
MGRKPCCTKQGLNRGTWSAQEDKVLINYIQIHGQGKWRDLPLKPGLNICGKSCRLRWLNYLRPDIKRGNISSEEDELIIRLHKLLGNRWSLIAGRLPGRTDNGIKNYWNTNLSKRKKLGTDHKMDHNVGALVQEEDNNSTQLIDFDIKELLSSSGSLQANDHQINENGDRIVADGDHLHHHCCLECSKFSYEAMFEDLMDERTTRLGDPFENNDHMMDLNSVDYFLNSEDESLID